MDKEKLIARINELAKKKKETGLTPEELDEQKLLRQEYIQNIRANVKATLDNTVFMKDLIVKQNTVSSKALQELKALDEIIKIEAINDNDYEIYYDVKKINEEQIKEIINNNR